jgi:hypothetical protein
MSRALGGIVFKQEGDKLVSTHPSGVGGTHTKLADGQFRSEYPVPPSGFGAVAPGATIAVSGQTVTVPAGFAGNFEQLFDDHRHDDITRDLAAAFAAPAAVPMGLIPVEREVRVLALGTTEYAPNGKIVVDKNADGEYYYVDDDNKTKVVGKTLDIDKYVAKKAASRVSIFDDCYQDDESSEGEPDEEGGPEEVPKEDGFEGLDEEASYNLAAGLSGLRLPTASEPRLEGFAGLGGVQVPLCG